MTGSTLPAVKRALVAALQARPGLADVTVSYQAPEKASDLANDSGVGDAVWLDSPDADAQIVVPFIKTPPRQFDEEYDVLVVVQSIRPESDGTQEVTDQRCAEMLAELVGVFASTSSLIDWSTEVPYCQTELVGWHPVAGRLPSGAGHGTRFEASVHVKARLALS